MPKKTTKADKLIEALCEKRVMSKFIEKITSEVVAKIDSKFKEMVLDMDEKIKI